MISQGIEESLEILEKFADKESNEAYSQTVGDFLIFKAMEMEKILETFPESPLKNLLKAITFFLGVEAQKIKQGFYF